MSKPKPVPKDLMFLRQTAPQFQGYFSNSLPGICSSSVQPCPSRESILHNDIVNASGNMTPRTIYIKFGGLCRVCSSWGVCIRWPHIRFNGPGRRYWKLSPTSGDAYERRYARKVLKLIVAVSTGIGKEILKCHHQWNFTHCSWPLFGRWLASSCHLHRVHRDLGEIIPQSIFQCLVRSSGRCHVRPLCPHLDVYHVPMYLPLCSLLDHILGEDHGTVYKKSGLKTLVTHKIMGVERFKPRRSNYH